MVPCQVCSTCWPARRLNRLRSQSFTMSTRAAPRTRHHSRLPSMMRTAPGGIATDPSATLEGVKAEAGLNVPVGRLGESGAVAQMVAFLASDAASFVTGQAINVSGGQELG